MIEFRRGKPLLVIDIMLFLMSSNFSFFKNLQEFLSKTFCREAKLHRSLINLRFAPFVNLKLVNKISLALWSGEIDLLTSTLLY